MVAVLGLGIGWLGLDMARSIVPYLGLQWHRDYLFLAVIFGVALLLLFAAYHLSRHPTGSTAAIAFDEEVITFERWGRLFGHRQYRIPRVGIAAIWSLNMPRSHTLGVELTATQAIKSGLRQATTKEDGVLPLPAPSLSFPAFGFALGPDAVIAAITKDLEEAGYRVGAENEGRRLPLGRRWPVSRPETKR
jgi:hypothetical protein